MDRTVVSHGSHGVAVGLFAGFMSVLVDADVKGFFAKLAVSGVTALVVGLLYTVGTILARRILPERPKR